MKTRAQRGNTHPPADEAVRVEWLRRVEAEYRSSAITGQLSHWLIVLAAPPALIRAGLRIAADELAHAELSHRVYRVAGGAAGPALPQQSLTLQRASPALDQDVTRVAVQTFCLGETAAVRLFHRMRAQCSVPCARKALDRILRDEVRHRDFGWNLLRWLLQRQDAHARRSEIAQALPEMVATLKRNYGGDDAHAAQPEPLPATRALRAWGLMPRAEYRTAVALCIERDLRPRFRRLEIAL